MGATTLAALALSAGCAGPRGTSDAPLHGVPLADAPRELTADQQVRHALDRLTFGPRPGDVARVRAEGVDRWIERQLHPVRIADAEIDAALAPLSTLGRSGGELLRDYPPPGQLLARLARERGAGAMAPESLRARVTVSRDDSLRLRAAARAGRRVVAELQAAKVARAVASERQLQETMVDFWENHFSVFAGKDRVRYYLPEYDATIRAHALGRFRDLLGAVAKSPAMLQYLDNWRSVADSTRPTLADARGARRTGAARRARGLNENYARELLELHTLGVDGGYTQHDVVDVARALTGWTLRPPQLGGGFVFRPEVHDAGAKTVLGTQLRAGRGIEDGEQVLDLVARHPSTARFIATKLARRFVSDTPPPALVARAAATFTRTGGDVRETLRTILHSPEFFASAAYRAKVKSPFELATSALRAVGAAPDTSPRTALAIARLGQPIFGHQAPDGWPETGEAWMNTGAILNRINFGLAVAAERVPGVRLGTSALAASAASLPRAAQVDAVVAALFGGAVSPDTRDVLLSGEHPLVRQPETRPRDGFAEVVGLALGAPEFQRR